MFPTERKTAYSYALVTLSRTFIILELFPYQAADGSVCLCIQANREEINQL